MTGVLPAMQHLTGCYRRKECIILYHTVENKICNIKGGSVRYMPGRTSFV